MGNKQVVLTASDQLVQQGQPKAEVSFGDVTSYIGRLVSVQAYVSVSPPVINGDGANITAMCTGTAKLGDVSYPISILGTLPAMQVFHAGLSPNMPMNINGIVTTDIELLARPSHILPLNEADAAILQSLVNDPGSTLIDIEELDPENMSAYAESGVMLKATGEINAVAIHMKKALLIKLTVDVRGKSIIAKAFEPSDDFCEKITGLLKQGLVSMMKSASSEQDIEDLTQHANTHIGSTVTIIGRVLKETYTNDQGTEFSSYVFRASNRHSIKLSSESDDEDEQHDLPVPSAAASASASSSSSASSAGYAHVD
jgi:hypothetical protein